jgi:hypothetical protein
MEVLFFVLMYFILSFPPRVAAVREESQIEQPRVRDVERQVSTAESGISSRGSHARQ